MSARGNDAAYPHTVEQQSVYINEGQIPSAGHFPVAGLTIREVFSMALMQGLLANSTLATLDDFNSGAVCRRAVQEADALLAELDK